MGELRKYRVTSNGNRTVLKLTEADAKLYPDSELIDSAPAGEGDPSSATTTRKARKPLNKARTDAAAPETKA
jgi:hypothetical protein